MFFFCKQITDLTKVLCRKTLPVHLAGGVRQLMSLIDYQGLIIIEKGMQCLQTVRSIGQ